MYVRGADVAPPDDQGVARTEHRESHRAFLRPMVDRAQQRSVRPDELGQQERVAPITLPLERALDTRGRHRELEPLE